MCFHCLCSSSFVVVLLAPQPQPATCPLSVVHQMIPCLLEPLLVATVLPKWRAYFRYDFPVVVTVVLVAHSPPVVWSFDCFPHALPWPIIFFIP